jgi:hypothetical protein
MAEQQEQQPSLTTPHPQHHQYPKYTEEWYRHVCGSPIRALPTYEELEAQYKSSAGPSACTSSSQQRKQNPSLGEKGYAEVLPIEVDGQKRDFWGLKRYFEKERLERQRSAPPAPHPSSQNMLSYRTGHAGRHYGVPWRNELPTPRERQNYFASEAQRRGSLVLDLDENVQDEEWCTVKCLCHMTDCNEGILFCDDCGTWQHIECYYPGQAELKRNIGHRCADCKPKPLNRVESEEWEMVDV